MIQFTSQDRASFDYLRSVCRSFEERLVLGEAVRQGWPAHAIEAEACIYSGRTSKKNKMRLAIQDAARRRYYSPEQRAADEAASNALQGERDARDAIPATRATRPNVPPEYKQIRAACRSLLDCDNLTAAIEAGWTVPQLDCLARQWCEVATRNRLKMKETPASYRRTLGFIRGTTPEDLLQWLPDRLKPSRTPKAIHIHETR